MLELLPSFRTYLAQYLLQDSWESPCSCHQDASRRGSLPAVQDDRQILPRALKAAPASTGLNFNDLHSYKAFNGAAAFRLQIRAI
ncbi:MAG: hypothetical protein JW999_00830 [Methanotrichaceae archaeon]|nr:hypothetical protein [Methanotrichaceae archaeon]